MKSFLVRFFLYFWACITGLALYACAPINTTKQPDLSLQPQLTELQTQNPRVPGFAMAAIHQGALNSAASGTANADGRAMTADTPIRIASITKTFVAAAVLRLWEQGEIDIDASIDELIAPVHNSLLTAEGYDTNAIKVRHLLMHASGLDDHFVTDGFKQTVLANPHKVWTRTEQLHMLVALTEPRTAPGETFFYSDSGYLLLGEIIERITGRSLADSVFALNNFEEIGLTATWWEGQQGQSSEPRGHQYLDGLDTYDIHGSVDTFGGGGLIMSVNDIARYFRALFKGDIFESKNTLQLMTRAPGHPEGSPYRFGLFTQTINGHTAYSHGGFWGTDAVAVPSLDLVIAGVSLEQDGTKAYRSLARDVVRQVIDKE